MAATPIAIFYKDPDATLDYSIDWSIWLQGDTISSVTWTVDAGITSTATSFGATVTTIWLSGGTDGTVYSVAAKITTAQGRVDERTIRLIVGQR